MHAGDLVFETLRLRPQFDERHLARLWSDAPDATIVELAAFEGAELWLCRRLSEVGAAATAPSTLVESVRRRALDIEARNLLVDAEVAAVVGHLARANVPFVLIKGIARRVAADRWPYSNARATNDVDVLVPADDATRGWNALREAGYQQASGATRHHLPPLLGRGRVGVELHVGLIEGVSPGESWRRATTGCHPIRWAGLEVRVPSATEMLWHGLRHALKNRDLGWRLRYLLDGASVLAGVEPVDWSIIAGRLAGNEGFDARLARAWLGAAAQMAGTRLPIRIGGGAPCDVPRMLRWRCAVLSRARRDTTVGRRLLEEGTRAAVGLGAAGLEYDAPVLRHLRRRVSAAAARLVYRVWRLLDGLRPPVRPPPRDPPPPSPRPPDAAAS